MNSNDNLWEQSYDSHTGQPVYPVPPNVQFVGNGHTQGQVPQTQIQDHPAQQNPVARSVQDLRQRFAPATVPAGFPIAKPTRPAWFYLAMVGVPSAAAVLSVMAIVIGMNSGGAVQRSSMEGMTAVAIESARQRGDVTCISWSCDKMGEALASQNGERFVKGGNMDVQWGDVKANLSQDANGAPSMSVGQAQAQTPIASPASAPVQYSIAQGTDAGGKALNIWQGNQVVNTIPNGDRLRVIQRSDGWVLVEWIGAGGFTGWVRSEGIQ
jgi:hypothetical protein